ncbi:MAG: hypothetical protein PHY94_01235 [Candidatus Omnitrophica bacterium]|nr:hypothetical protein [Candidatus Omnitrophota bacterium]
MKTRIFIAFLVFFFIFSFSQAWPGERKRVILAIFDSTDPYSESEDNNLIHNNAEMVLNYLGMKVKFHDLTKGLPSDETMEEVYGILTWFKNDNLPNAVQYCHWVSNQVRKGKKLVMLGNFGAYKDSKTNQEVPEEILNEIFHSINLEYDGEWIKNPFVIEVKYKDSQMVEFERSLKDELLLYEKITSLDSRNKVYLELNRTDIKDGKSAVVITTPNGGYAAESYEIFIDPITDKMRWRINPFLFFAQAFDLKDAPRFDTTTLFGRRIFYSHIDGDGLRTPSEIDRSRICAEIIHDEILKKYDLPITVSFIVAEIDPRYYGSSQLMELAKEMLKPDNIEAGVHGFTHPLDWKRQLTVFAIKGYSRQIITGQDLDLLSESLYDVAMRIYVDRTKMVEREIKLPVEYVNQNLLSGNKKVVLFQWTGDCRPFAAAIAMTKLLGIENINGGDSRFDNEVPSFTGVAALGRQDHDSLQPYTSNANDNIYTNRWTGPFYGYKFVRQTFEQTERPSVVKTTPRRISPINVYYHYYSGQKQQSLDAVKQVYDYALKQEIIPIFTSEYAAIVEGFYSGKISQLVPGAWEFRDYGNCRTVRLDDCHSFPDLEKSKGILGFCHWENFLYIHLDQGNQALLYLTKEAPKRAYLVSASAIVSNLNISPENISFSSRGFGDAVYKFANFFPEATYQVRIIGEDKVKEIFAKNFNTDKDGILEIKVPAKGRIEVVITKR